MRIYKPEDNKIDGWMSDSELLWLCNKAQLMDSIVEVGCWAGRSTHALLNGCSGLVNAVDHFHGSPAERATTHARVSSNDIHAELMRNVGHYQNLRVFKMDSIEASRSFADKSVDMVFIDGDHEYEAVKADIKAWCPKCNRLLCGHDIEQNNTRAGIQDALREFGLEFVKETDTTIWSVTL